MRTPIRRIAAVAALVLTALMLGGSAASAHVSVIRTNLTIQMRGGPVASGTAVTITGKLTGNPACRAGQEIELVRLGAGTVATTTTNASGWYRFTIVASEDASYQARFDGSTVGVHPHSHICTGSTSRPLKLKVRGGGGNGAGTGDGPGTAVLGEGGSSADGAGTQVLGATGTAGTAAFTGSDAWPFIAVGIALLAIGVVASVIARWSRRGESNP